ncbi:MAG TPA: glycosyltransferase, partial [Thermoanaerobaculia bacterium]|nr:glycosyltransferase [Thermoanaerobaculia bacterium]
MSRSVPTLRSNLPSLAPDELVRAQQGLLLVSPTYNERRNLEELVTRVFTAAPHCHLLVVDDNSPDGTG